MQQSTQKQSRPSAAATLARDSRDPAHDPALARLAALLSRDPIELRGVAEAIRDCSELESFILRVCASLVLAAELPSASLEEAAILLGADRLRVLVQAWSVMRDPAFGDAASLSSAGPAPASPHALPSVPPAPPLVPFELNAAQRLATWTPEMLYLATFFHSLGFDSTPPPLSPLAGKPVLFPSGQISALTDVLMRDVLSLIPVIEPSILQPVRRGAAVVRVPSLPKEGE
jgi:hypothetical protein